VLHRFEHGGKTGIAEFRIFEPKAKGRNPLLFAELPHFDRFEDLSKTENWLHMLGCDWN